MQNSPGLSWSEGYFPQDPHRVLRPGSWGSTRNKRKSALVVEPTHLKNISQIGNLPQFSAWKEKIFELPPPRKVLKVQNAIWHVKFICGTFLERDEMRWDWIWSMCQLIQMRSLTLKSELNKRHGWCSNECNTYVTNVTAFRLHIFGENPLPPLPLPSSRSCGRIQNSWNSASGPLFLHSKVGPWLGLIPSGGLPIITTEVSVRGFLGNLNEASNACKSWDSV